LNRPRLRDLLFPLSKLASNLLVVQKVHADTGHSVCKPFRMNVRDPAGEAPLLPRSSANLLWQLNKDLNELSFVQGKICCGVNAAGGDVHRMNRLFHQTGCFGG
jgi:hypothetical protein